jgi:cardiolipin synthase (CMP-forming)
MPFYDARSSRHRLISRSKRAATLFMNMNVPNSLTILRILLIPVYVGLLNYEQFDYALATLFIAGLTDALDGTIARVANQRTRLGEVLDPLADKLLLTTGFITLSVMHLVPLWITILVVSRDLMLMLGAAVAHFTNTQVDISPTALGKGTTLIQLTTLVAVVFFASRRMDLAVLDPLLYVMGVVTLLSGLHYLSRGYGHVSSGQT